MTDAFSDAYANFSGITNTSLLKISDVVHKAYIGVDESGSEAAAATGVIMQAAAQAYEPPPPPPIEFNADHPFLFMIRDTQSGSVLFMGQEADPKSAAGDSSAPAIDPNAPPPVAADPPVDIPPIRLPIIRCPWDPIYILPPINEPDPIIVAPPVRRPFCGPLPPPVVVSTQSAAANVALDSAPIIDPLDQ